MKKPDPIFLADLVADIDAELITLLRHLPLDAWESPTILSQWNVKDIVAHLLDGNLRTLSMLRDGYYGVSPGNIDSYEALVSYLNQLNAQWVQAVKRLSPQVLIDLLEQSGQAYHSYLKQLAPFEKATFSVAWAGEEESLNWFHVAREYTEKWHHQQQIRLAMGEGGELLREKWFFPYLDTSIRALPHHYRHVQGSTPDLLRIVFSGERDKVWYLQWQPTGWQLWEQLHETPTCELIIPDDVAWRIFTKAIRPEAARAQAQIKGQSYLAEPIFSMVAVMA